MLCNVIGKSWLQCYAPHFTAVLANRAAVVNFEWLDEHHPHNWLHASASNPQEHMWPQKPHMATPSFDTPQVNTHMHTTADMTLLVCMQHVNDWRCHEVATTGALKASPASI
jgi:hypothetical protein